jgi:aromatic ring hydroxylase
MKESAKALNSVERKSEIVTKLEGLFSLALMAYKDAQRQNKDGSRVPDPYAQGILLQRAVEILERLAELSGFISRKGFVVTQTVNAEQKQSTLDFRQIVNKYRLERGLAPIPLDDK